MIFLLTGLMCCTNCTSFLQATAHKGLRWYSKYFT